MEIARAVLLMIALAATAAGLSGQTAGEASASMGNSGVSAQTSTSRAPASRSSNARNSSRHGASASLTVPSGPPADEVNRKKFEESARKNAGKVLFRSVPSGASIFLNHLFVGRTPLLLFVAPGKYDVQIRDEGERSVRRALAVAPKQSQTMVIGMKQQYPSSVSLRW